MARDKDRLVSQSAHIQPQPEWSFPRASVLTWDDLDAVRAALSEAAPSWSAELNQTSWDDSSIVAMPEAASDLLGPSFILHRTGGRVHLDMFRWDEYRKLGAFGSLNEALSAMRSRLAVLAASGL